MKTPNQKTGRTFTVSQLIEGLRALKPLAAPDAPVIFHHATTGEFGADDDLTECDIRIQNKDGVDSILVTIY